MLPTLHVLLSGVVFLVSLWSFLLSWFSSGWTAAAQGTAGVVGVIVAVCLCACSFSHKE